MKTFPKDMTFTVEQIADRWKSAKPLNPRLRVEWTKEQTLVLLEGACMAEVADRRGKYNKTDAFSDHLDQVCEWLLNGKKMSLMLAGKPGNGKTTLMKAIKRLANFAEIETGDNVRCRMPLINSNELTRICKEDYQRFQKICKMKFLALDDVGREPVEVKDYGNVLNPVVELVQYRYDEQLPIVMTTNLSASAIADRYGERIKDRFKEIMDIIVFEDKSFRGNTND